MSLLTYLKSKSIVTGKRRKATSHSAMSRNKTLLLGEKVTTIDKIYLRVGKEVHRRMESKRAINKGFSVQELEDIQGMVKSLSEHPVVKKLLVRAKLEQRKKCILNGQKVTVILDVEQALTGVDYKTTKCKSLSDFIKKAIEYGYVRQGVTYKIGRKLRKFFFIAVQKVKPYNVFVFDLDSVSKEVKYALAELEFLLYFNGVYGKINY